MAKALLVLGTTSHAGKSLVAAGLCRLLADAGYRVAPFKAQNMANNSGVTPDGGEIGRAQMLQALAARCLPRVAMNPVLLKPTGEGSQVVLMGQPGPTLSTRQYYRFWPKAAKVAQKAYRDLEQDVDWVVIEGAGSPAEVNLAHRDLANLETARFTGAPWILVADIERGGVFASIVGTLDLVPAWLRRRCVGVVINKFRGDVGLLNPGIAWLKKTRGIRTLGVIPYLQDLKLDEEDSLGLPSCDSFIKKEKSLKIEVILNQCISNFNDIRPLQGLRGVDLAFRYPGQPSPFAKPDCIILPGTKNTLEALWQLQKTGEANRIRDLNWDKTWVVGLCGGYQMLGLDVADVQGIEGARRRGEGLGLLGVHTRFEQGKELVAGEAEARLWGKRFAVKGYEIHQGQTLPLPGAKVWLRRNDGQALGVLGDGGRVMGTYLHGVFENPVFTLGLLNAIAKDHHLKKNFKLQDLSFNDQDKELDRWAQHLRQCLNLKGVLPCR